MNNKQVLKDYVDACELVKETEADIARLKKKRQMITQATVRGSNPDFPYQSQSFKISGTAFDYKDDKNLRYEEKMLEERKQYAEQIRLQAQAVINRAPVRIQRIIRLRYMKKLSWDNVAVNMAEEKTGDSYRKELNDYLKQSKK